MRFVLDASATLAFAFPDERDDEARALVERVRTGGAIAPLLWAWEIENVVTGAVRQKRLSPVAARTLLAQLAALPVELDAGVAFGAEITLAQRYRLTIYDALYLELAVRRNASLATRDRRLAQAARDLGLEALGS